MYTTRPEKAWLKDLKAGDLVAETYNGFDGPLYQALRVERVTATQIALTTGSKYRVKDGSNMKEYSMRYLSQYTDEIKEAIAVAEEREAVVKEFRALRVNWERLPLSVLASVIDIIKASGVE